MNRRQYLTPREKLAVLVKQQYRCSCGCGKPIWPVHRIEWEHTLALGLFGQSKPDAAMLYLCHKVKTRSDKRMMTKADNQRKAFEGTKAKSGPKMQSRGFKGWRKFNGDLVVRRPDA